MNAKQCEKIRDIYVRLEDVYKILDGMMSQGNISKQDLNDAMNFLFASGHKLQDIKTYSSSSLDGDEELRDKLISIVNNYNK